MLPLRRGSVQEPGENQRIQWSNPEVKGLFVVKSKADGCKHSHRQDWLLFFFCFFCREIVELNQVNDIGFLSQKWFKNNKNEAALCSSCCCFEKKCFRSFFISPFLPLYLELFIFPYLSWLLCSFRPGLLISGPPDLPLCLFFRISKLC